MARGASDTSSADADEDPLEHLIEISDWKLFKNLSWRLLRLLTQGVDVEPRKLHKGDSLEILQKTGPQIDVVYVQTGDVGITPWRKAVWQGRPCFRVMRRPCHRVGREPSPFRSTETRFLGSTAGDTLQGK